MTLAVPVQKLSPPLPNEVPEIQDRTLHGVCSLLQRPSGCQPCAGFLGSQRAFNALYGKALAAAKGSKKGSKEAEAGLLSMEGLHKQVCSPCCHGQPPNATIAIFLVANCAFINYYLGSAWTLPFCGRFLLECAKCSY